MISDILTADLVAELARRGWKNLRADIAIGDLQMSTAEIAERLGVKKMTVHQWRYRGIFPEPDWQLSIGPVWKWSTVERWAESTGRLTSVNIG